MKVQVLGDERTLVLYSLGGVNGKVVGSKEESLKIVAESKDVGVFLIVDDFFPSDFKQDFPILVKIPRRRLE